MSKRKASLLRAILETPLWALLLYFGLLFAFQRVIFRPKISYGLDGEPMGVGPPEPGLLRFAVVIGVSVGVGAAISFWSHRRRMARIAASEDDPPEASR